MSCCICLVLVVISLNFSDFDTKITEKNQSQISSILRETLVPPGTIILYLIVLPGTIILYFDSIARY